MRPRGLLFVIFTFTVLVAWSPGHAQDRPITGRAVSTYAPLDGVVEDFMDTIGATAASLAVTENGRLVYARGYGWSDENQTTPTEPDTPFRIASNTKPITAAVVKELIRSRRLSASTPVIQYLEIQPYNGEIGDPRLAEITIEHLLAHEGGWDKDQSFDPMYRIDTIKQEMGLDGEITTTHIVEYMLAQPLQFSPGERRAYSNFGYLLLGRVIEKTAGKPYDEVVQLAICRPLRISDIRMSATDPRDRDPNEVFYPNESGMVIELRDALGGLTSSAPSLCAFMNKYWINGDPRNRRERRSHYHFGSHPNSTTALMEQRDDGIDYAVLFNARRNEHSSEDNEALRSAINEVLDQIR